MKMHTFSLRAPKARSVAVAGTFNQWDPTRTHLRKDKDGNWRAEVSLPPGRHEYRFVVDGDWVSDPNAKHVLPNPFGSTNSIVDIWRRGETLQGGVETISIRGESFIMREPKRGEEDLGGSAKGRRVGKTLEEKRRS